MQHKCVNHILYINADTTHVYKILNSGMGIDVHVKLFSTAIHVITGPKSLIFCGECDNSLALSALILGEI